MEFTSSFLANNSMTSSYLTYDFNFPDSINGFKLSFSGLAMIMFARIETKD